MGELQPAKSQGKRLLQELLAKGQRIFNMNDFVAAAEGHSIPRAQLKKIVSTLVQQK